MTVKMVQVRSFEYHKILVKMTNDKEICLIQPKKIRIRQTFLYFALTLIDLNI